MIEINLNELPLGDIPRRNDAIGEFHCVRPDPAYAGWHEPTNHWTWQGSNWRVGEDADGRFIEQLHNSRYNNTLIVSDAEFTRVRRIEAEVFCPTVTQEVGIAFRFRTALDYLCFHLDPDGIKFSSRLDGHFFVEQAAPRQGSNLAGRWIKLGVSLERHKIQFWLDDDLLFQLGWGGHLDGRVGLLANCPARFRALWVEGRRVRHGKKAVAPRHPAMRVVRKIETAGFGTSRQIRFGDLDGDGQLEILLAQPAPLEGAPGYGVLGALTALKTNGEVLWHSGQPVASRPIAGDLPFQINDIDGDGRNEVVAVRGFEIQVLDGATGRPKLTAPVPDRPVHNPLLATCVSYFGAPRGEQFPRVVTNAIRFADLAGRGAARDLLLKDHYHHLWALSPDLKPLWFYVGNLGHFPFCADLDGDGRDEVAVGYHLLSADGKDIQSLHLGDHADAVFAGDIQGWGEPRVVRAGGDDGLLIAGPRGDWLAVHHGHVQRLSIARFRRESPGLQYMICTYWGAPGIVAFLDSTAKLIWSREDPVCGNTLQPVNWTGEDEELIYYSAHADHGGLYNWEGRQVVPFPSDGHPEMCSEVLDLFGSGRDNLVVWDPDRLWIYAPAGDAEPRYRPRRPPLHSWSNYMCYWSLPGEG